MLPFRLTHAYHWLVGALLKRQTFALEVFLAVQAMSWGVWVANPWSHALSAVPEAYTVLNLLPEWVVGLGFFVHGAVHLWVISQRDTKRCRDAALGSFFLWGVVVVNLSLGVPALPAIVVYSCSALAALWIYLRLDWRFG